MNSPVRGPRAAAKLVLALVALVLVLLPGLASADQSGAGPGGNGTGTVKNGDGTLKFGMGPANNVPAKQVVDGRAYLIYAANPGATIKDKVAILNYDTKPLTLKVYATDAVQSDTGVFGLLPGNDAPMDAGKWITQDVPKNKKITVPGRVGQKSYGVKYISFTAHVPRKATPGDHVGGIVGSLQTVSRNTKGAKVTLDQRIGVRAYFSLTGDLQPHVVVEDLKASYDDQWDPLGRGLYTVSYFVHNTGNLRLNVSQDVTVNRCIIAKVLCPAGKLVAHPAELKDLLPGTRLQITQTFENRFGLGHHSAEVTLHPTAIDLNYTTKIPTVTATTGFWAWPWLLLIEIAVVLLLIGLGIWRYQRRRRALARDRELAASAPQPKHAAPLPGEDKPARLSRGGRRRTPIQPTRSPE